MSATATRSRLTHAVLTVFAYLALSGAAFAADFASQITRIVVPFAPGGGTDIISRTLAQEMAKELGGPVIIENKPGAGTIVGTCRRPCPWPQWRAQTKNDARKNSTCASGHGKARHRRGRPVPGTRHPQSNTLPTRLPCR